MEEESTIIIIVKGEQYELLKSKFKSLRKKFEMVNLGGSPERHSWMIKNETVSAEYIRADNEELIQVRIIWKGHMVSPLLDRLLLLFVDGV